MNSGIYPRTEEHNKKISESYKGRIPWNKGLTKEDPRVKKYTDKLIGRKLPETQKAKQSETMKKLYAEGKLSPPNKNKLNSLPQNCVCLCNSCHSKTNFNRVHWIKFFQSLLAERYGYKYDENQNIILNLNNQLNFRRLKIKCLT